MVAEIKKLIDLAANAVKSEDALRFSQAAANVAHALAATPAAAPRSDTDMTDDDKIKRIVDRFLSWKLPEDFAPDNGIEFHPLMNADTPFQCMREPTGTNLFTARQAEAMVRYMLEQETST